MLSKAVSPIRAIAQRMMSTAGEALKFETLVVSRPADFVVQVEMNRPEKRNSLNTKIWGEIEQCFNRLSRDEDCRVILFTGAGKTFCAGLDFSGMGELAAGVQDESKDVSRRAFFIRTMIQAAQNSSTAMEKCPKPVIAAIQGGCLGGGMGLITACDIRYASMDSFFTIKEIDIGLAADVGTLQRMPKNSSSNGSLLRELIFTGRNFQADEALRIGLISRVFQSHEKLLDGALRLAKEIASKSPVAVQGSKVNLNYSRDHSVDDGLDYMVTWNAAHLQGEDLVKAAMAAAARDKEPPTFAKL